MNSEQPTITSTEKRRLTEANFKAEASKSGQERFPISSKLARVDTTFGVNLCASPGSNVEWVGLLGPQTVVSLLQHREQEDGTIWYYVKAGAQYGWVSDSYLKEIE